MVEINTLLSLLEFIALLAPAFVILRQVLAGHREDLTDPGLPAELWIVRYGLILVLAGGLIIGWKLLMEIDDLMILGGILLVFGSLPFLAAAVWLSDYQITLGMSDTRDVRQLLSGLLSLTQQSRVVRVPTVVVVSTLLMGGAWMLSRQTVEQHLQWGIFLTNEALSPAVVLGAELFLMGIGGIFWTLAEIRSNETVETTIDVVFETVLTQLIVLAFYLVPVGLVFGIWLSAIVVFGARPTTSDLWSIPVAWSLLVSFALALLAVSMTEEVSEDAVASVMLTHTVEDYERWASHYDDHTSVREELGELGYQLFHTSEDPNEVFVFSWWDREEDARTFFESSDFRKEMEAAGVVGDTEIHFFNEIATTTHGRATT